MKYTLLISLFALLILGCEKPVEEPEGYEYFGNASAMKNATFWECETYALREDEGSEFLILKLNYYSGGGYRRGGLSFSHIPQLVGKYPVFWSEHYSGNDFVTSRYHAYIDDGDIQVGTWNVHQDTTEGFNFIEVTSISQETGEMTGIFRLAMELDPRFNDWRLPEANEPKVIVFEEGYFYTRFAN